MKETNQLTGSFIIEPDQSIAKIRQDIGQAIAGAPDGWFALQAQIPMHTTVIMGNKDSNRGTCSAVCLDDGFINGYKTDQVYKGDDMLDSPVSRKRIVGITGNNIEDYRTALEQSQIGVKEYERRPDRILGISCFHNSNDTLDYFKDFIKNKKASKQEGFDATVDSFISFLNNKNHGKAAPEDKNELLSKYGNQAERAKKTDGQEASRCI